MRRPRAATTKVIKHEEEELDRIEDHISLLGCDYEEYVKELIACDMFNGDFLKRMNIRKSMEVILESAKNLGVDPEVAELVITKLLNGQINRSTLTQPIVAPKPKIEENKEEHIPIAKLVSSPVKPKVSQSEDKSIRLNSNTYQPDTPVKEKTTDPEEENDLQEKANPRKIIDTYCAKAYPK